MSLDQLESLFRTQGAVGVSMGFVDRQFSMMVTYSPQVRAFGVGDTLREALYGALQQKEEMTRAASIARNIEVP